MPSRLKQCVEYASVNPTCPVEAAFHPNRKGAERYANAILSALEEFIPAWRMVQ